MEQLIQQLHLPRHTVYVAGIGCLLLLLICWGLFGVVGMLLVCAVCGLSYCAASYLFYRPEATSWRDRLEECYEGLFMRALVYKHGTSFERASKNKTTSKSQLRASKNEKKNEIQLPAVSEPPIPPSQQEDGAALLSSTQQGAEDGSIKHAFNDVQPSKMCHREAQKMIQLIMRDFIHTWYSDLANDVEFPEDVQKVLEHVSLEVNVRLQQIDLEETVCEIVTLVIPYLEVLNKAGVRCYNGVEFFEVNNEVCLKDFESNPNVAHSALRTPEQELKYYRQALDAVIQCAFPDQYGSCGLACMFVREILLLNIVQPVLNLLCDPDFLFESIPIILSKASVEKVQRELSDIQLENEDLEKTLNRGRLIVNIRGSQGKHKRRFHSVSGQFGHSSHFPNGSSPSPTRKSPKVKPRPKSMVASTSTGRAYNSDGRFAHSTQVPLHALEESELESDPTYRLRNSHQQLSPSLARPRSRDSGTYTDSAYYTQVGGSLSSETTGAREHFKDVSYREDWDEPDQALLDGDYAMVNLAPIFIERHVRVESGVSNHTAYIFKFPKWMLFDDELKKLHVLESETHLEGMNRFSHFSKLHNSLLLSPLKIYVKGLILPNKRGFSSFVAKLPFASNEPDPTVLLERRQGLEKYLQSICSVEMILRSEPFHQFLVSGVEDLKEAHIVNPPKASKQNRKSFLGIVRSEDTHKAEPVPKRPIEEVISSYLNTHLPLPCHSLHSLHSIRNKRSKRQRGHTMAVTGSLKKANTTTTTTLQRAHSIAVGTPVPSPLRKQASLASLGSNHSADGSLASTGSLEQISSTKATLDIGSGGGIKTELSSLAMSQTSLNSAISEKGKVPDIESAIEAIHDTGDMNNPSTIDPTRSVSNSIRSNSVMVSSYNHVQPDEEGHTIGAPVSLSQTDSINSSLHSTQSDSTDGQTGRSKSNPRQVSFGSTSQSVRKHSRVLTHGGSREILPNEDETEHFFIPRLKSLFLKLLLHIHYLICLVIFVIQQGLKPTSPAESLSLAKEQNKRVPLANAVLSLGSKASERHCQKLWACSQNTQLAILVLVGGGMERFLWKELKEVVYCDENWARALYHLRHTLWPGGKLMKTSNKKLSEEERLANKRKAADAIKKFLPNFLPPIVGAKDYDKAVVHCLDCLQNPRINRHFFLRIIGLLMTKLVPEFADRDYQKRLSQLRTLKPLHNKPVNSSSNQ